MTPQSPGTSYDSVSDLYDAVRPGYPQPLYRDICALLSVQPHSSVLDIGCGTGKSTRVFAGHGHPVVALDPGDSMLSRCRANLGNHPSVEFVNSSLEAWDSGNRVFDLVISGTAFHWVNDDELQRTCALIDSQGGIAIFWHTFLNGQGPFFATLDAIYHEFARELYVDDLNATQQVVDYDKEQAFARVRSLSDVRFLRYYTQQRYSADEYVGLLRTFSTHRSLEPAFFKAVHDSIERDGGFIEKPIRTTCLVARPRRSPEGGTPET